MFNVPPSFVITTIVSAIWLVVWLIAQRGAKDRFAPAPSHGAPAVEG
jgi:hypothetical protein